MPDSKITRASDDPAEQDRASPVTLKLRRSHWHLTEDIADNARRAGCRYRLGPSEIIRGVLDGVLPVLLKADFMPLAEQVEGQNQATSRTTVSEWMGETVARLLRRR